MSIAATVRALVNAGCTPEQIAAAVEAWEADANVRAAERRAAEARRKKQYRDRVSQMSQNVPGTDRDTPAPSSPQRDIIKPPTNPAPLVSSEPAVSDTSNAKPKRTKLAYANDFEAFWQAYPTDRLMSKLETFRAWGRLSPEDRVAASAAVPAFRAHCAKDPTYRPIHACRFLSQRRFDGFASATGPPAEPQFASVREYAEWRDRQHAEGKLQ